ncbi:MAG: Nre family DNA repair protein [Nanoarchaeota archaeon]|nr:Nre family DNA repair protein [Nanoarchaeota archaeon]
MDCIRCKGNANSKYSCKKGFCPILQKFREALPKVNLDFNGSSPPDVFVGQYNYPNVFAGILAPAQHDDTANKLSAPEEWFKERLGVHDILQRRGSMIYSRFTSNVKSRNEKLKETMQEISMAQKPCDMEFHLAKKPSLSMELNNYAAPIGNPAPLLKAEITENPFIPRKVDAIVSDNGLKATEAVKDLYKHDFTVTSMVKLLTSGLLGCKLERRMVPTRWAITAVDDMVSKQVLQKVKDYPWINEYRVYHDEYVGNHYEIILLPRQWSFEVIEAKMPGSCWNSGMEIFFMKDNEGYFGRKTYASEVTGAYYSCRLAIAEHLRLIKRQASALILREVRDEYFAPCGVGILRETVRNAMSKKPELFNTVEEALKAASTRMKIPVNKFTEASTLLKEAKQQKTLFAF